jgi:hypothetical protein
MKEIEREETAKISISKSLHEKVKKICLENGLKMQYFEDKAIEAYIISKYPEYMKENS